MFNILLWIIVICGAFILFVVVLGIFADLFYEIDEIRKHRRIEKYLKEAEEKNNG